MFQLGCWRLKHHRPLGGLVPRPSSRSSVPEGLEQQHIDPGKVPARKAPRNLTSYRQRARKVEVNTCDSACSPPCCYSCCQSLLIAALPTDPACVLVCACVLEGAGACVLASDSSPTGSTHPGHGVLPLQSGWGPNDGKTQPCES